MYTNAMPINCCCWCASIFVGFKLLYASQNQVKRRDVEKKRNTIGTAKRKKNKKIQRFFLILCKDWIYFVVCDSVKQCHPYEICYKLEKKCWKNNKASLLSTVFMLCCCGWGGKKIYISKWIFEYESIHISFRLMICDFISFLFSLFVRFFFCYLFLFNNLGFIFFLHYIHIEVIRILYLVEFRWEKKEKRANQKKNMKFFILFFSHMYIEACGRFFCIILFVIFYVLNIFFFQTPKFIIHGHGYEFLVSVFIRFIDIIIMIISSRCVSI